MKILKVDLDSKEENTINRFLFALSLLKQFYTFTNWECYETAKGLHVYMLIEEDINEKELILIQALLGSDINRELFNLIRFLRSGKSKNVLFKRKRSSDGYISKEEVTPLSLKIEMMIGEVVI